MAATLRASMLRQMQRGVCVDAAGLPGCARLELAQGVVPLNPAPAVFEAMLEGWATQQRTRFLKEDDDRAAGWSWCGGSRSSPTSTRGSGSRPRWRRSSPSAVGGAADHGLDGAGLPEHAAAVLRVRHRRALRLGRRSAWSSSGRCPVQILHEWNTVAHVTEYEGRPRRRPLTYDEVQALFDAADGRVEADPGPRPQGRAGGAARRGAAEDDLRVTGCAAGRRAAWTWPICGTTRRRRSSAGTARLFVRWGKSSRRQPAQAAHRADGAGDGLGRRRCWSTGSTRSGPLLGPGRASGAVGHRAARPPVSVAAIDEAFAAARAAAGLARRAGPALPAPLLCHAPGRVRLPGAVRRKTRPGTAYASTTAIYTGVSDEYRNRLLRRSLEATARAVGGRAVNRKMGYRWHLRPLMADRGMFHTTRPGAAAGRARHPPVP